MFWNRFVAILFGWLFLCRTTCFVCRFPRDRVWARLSDLCIYPGLAVGLQTIGLHKRVDLAICKYRTRISCRLWIHRCTYDRLSTSIFLSHAYYSNAILLNIFYRQAKYTFPHLQYCFHAIDHRMWCRLPICSSHIRVSIRLDIIHQIWTHQAMFQVLFHSEGRSATPQRTSLRSHENIFRTQTPCRISIPLHKCLHQRV